MCRPLVYSLSLQSLLACFSYLCSARDISLFSVLDIFNYALFHRLDFVFLLPLVTSLLFHDHIPCFSRFLSYKLYSRVWYIASLVPVISRPFTNILSCSSSYYFYLTSFDGPRSSFSYARCVIIVNTPWVYFIFVYVVYAIVYLHIPQQVIVPTVYLCVSCGFYFLLLYFCLSFILSSGWR